jgi:succinate-semialdehyde dehydrogenase / glutarate-semialdehyde dehydrogenase
VGDYERAIHEAHAAFLSWKATTSNARGKSLRSWAKEIQASCEDLAALCTLELGKPFKESLSAVKYAINCVNWFANLAETGCGGETIPNSGARDDTRILTIRQPVGVVGAITPWNSPFSGVLKKIAPAIAVGCTVVHKPAPETALCAIALAKTSERAGIPAGVYNVLTSSGSTAAQVGSLFSSHALVRHVTFTGSTGVGRYLAERCGSNLKKVTMELGGNAPFIVFDDADLDQAVRGQHHFIPIPPVVGLTFSVEGLLACKFTSSGQVCIFANRVLVHTKIHDLFVEKLQHSIRQHIRLGSPWDERTTLGPVYARQGAEKVNRLVNDAILKGAECLTSDDYEPGSTYYPAKLLIKVTGIMDISREEIFGPVVAISVFQTEAEAVEIANSANTGLAGYVYTENISRLFRVAEALQVGMVGARTGTISAIEQPFGGIKDSGLGREGSRHALEEYTDLKAITLAL